MKNTAIYPGSFDPFTNGHLDIVRKAAALFNKVYIIIGINATKKRSFDAEIMKPAIEKALMDNGLDNCEVCIFNGLVAEFAAEHNAGYMIRGLRNNMDYNYEENIAEINKLINPDLEYVYFRADNVAVSSSMVKELAYYGKDVGKYVPNAVLKLFN
ncbi:MAG: pantetheine-phosphate adenylyltransferase [Clostridia bacterium]|nr:pantetheine-phosphate adenylyltransferase [Clostridia bacterium]